MRDKELIDYQNYLIEAHLKGVDISEECDCLCDLITGYEVRFEGENEIKTKLGISKYKKKLSKLTDKSIKYLISILEKKEEYEKCAVAVKYIK